MKILILLAAFSGAAGLEDDKAGSGTKFLETSGSGNAGEEATVYAGGASAGGARSTLAGSSMLQEDAYLMGEDGRQSDLDTAAPPPPAAKKEKNASGRAMSAAKGAVLGGAAGALAGTAAGPGGMAAGAAAGAALGALAGFMLGGRQPKSGLLEARGKQLDQALSL